MHHRRVVGALRVSPAITRLTVYRRHQVMVAWMIAGPFKAKLFVARDPFNDDVLRLLPSDCNEDPKQTRLDIKEDCLRRECQSKCCAWSTSEGQVLCGVMF